MIYVIIRYGDIFLQKEESPTVIWIKNLFEEEEEIFKRGCYYCNKYPVVFCVLEKVTPDSYSYDDTHYFCSQGHAEQYKAAKEKEK